MTGCFYQRYDVVYEAPHVCNLLLMQAAPEQGTLQPSSTSVWLAARLIKVWGSLRSSSILFLTVITWPSVRTCAPLSAPLPFGHPPLPHITLAQKLDMSHRIIMCLLFCLDKRAYCPLWLTASTHYSCVWWQRNSVERSKTSHSFALLLKVLMSRSLFDLHEWVMSHFQFVISSFMVQLIVTATEEKGSATVWNAKRHSFIQTRSFFFYSWLVLRSFVFGSQWNRTIFQICAPTPKPCPVFPLLSCLSLSFLITGFSLSMAD